MGVAYHDSWARKLKLVQFSINNSISTVTGYSPFFAFWCWSILFGRGGGKPARCIQHQQRNDFLRHARQATPWGMGAWPWQGARTRAKADQCNWGLEDGAGEKPSLQNQEAKEENDRKTKKENASDPWIEKWISCVPHGLIISNFRSPHKLWKIKKKILHSFYFLLFK